MNVVDLIIIAVLALSVLVGLWRGLISEVLALVTWIAAFWVAFTYGPAVSAHFDRSIENPIVRMLIGYGICFIAVLILGALVRFVLHQLVDSTGLGGTDRLLGMIFGFARGVLLVTLMVFLVNLTSFAHESMLQQ
jgi:membrane protein required for colicin V production